MELALESAMPTYSGGLGVLAGDTLQRGQEGGVPDGNYVDKASSVGQDAEHSRGKFSPIQSNPSETLYSMPRGTNSSALVPNSWRADEICRRHACCSSTGCVATHAGST